MSIADGNRSGLGGKPRPLERSMTSRSGWVVFLVLAGSGSLHAQLPRGYSVAPAEPLPDFVEESHFGGRITLSVQRDVGDERSRAMVTLAEALLPSPDSIEVVIDSFLQERGGAPGLWADRLEEARARPGPRWAFMHHDELIPFALHGNAAAHFIRRFHDILGEHGTNPNAQLEIAYSATVEPGEDGGFSVLLTLSFRKSCGALCGSGFFHERRVDFGADGAVLAVSGDGLSPTVWIS